MLSDLDHEALEKVLGQLSPEERPRLLRFCRDWTSADGEEILAAFPELHPASHSGIRTYPFHSRKM